MRYPTCPHCGRPVSRQTLFVVDLDRAQPCPACRGLITRGKMHDWIVVLALLVPPTGIVVLAVPFPGALVWLIAAAGAWVALWAWTFPYFARVRAHPPVCLTCGYDLRGLSEPATCPECGRVAEVCRGNASESAGPRGA